MLAGLLNQFEGVHITQETGFIADLYQPDMNCLTDWPAKQLDQLMNKAWSYLERQGWKNRPVTADFMAFAQRTGCTGYAGLVRYCWELDTTHNHAANKDTTESSPRFTYLGDNTPRYTLAIPLLQRLFPDARYIHLVRDGRDVVCSLINRHFGANSLLCAARSWMAHVGCWQMAERTIPADSRMELRYEDLVHDCRSACDKFSNFLGTTVNNSSASLDVHGLANRLPHHSRLDSPIDSASVGRFYTELNDRQRSDVEAVMYSGLVAYGYDVGPFKPSAVMLDRSVLLTGSHVLDLMKRAVRKVQPCP